GRHRPADHRRGEQPVAGPEVGPLAGNLRREEREGFDAPHLDLDPALSGGDRPPGPLAQGVDRLAQRVLRRADHLEHGRATGLAIRRAGRESHRRTGG
ncbi:MAG: hypothetical protein ACK559_24045, partial [bacterium]